MRSTLRISGAAVLSLGMTAATLAVVAALQQDPPAAEDSPVSAPKTMVVVAPPPPPEPALAPPVPASVSPTTDAATNAEVTPLAPHRQAPRLAGLSASAVPQGLSLGATTPGALPSVADLPSVASAPEARKTAARVLHRPAPDYPAQAQRSAVEGFVTLRIRVDPSGRVDDAVVVHAEPRGVFEEAALQAVRRYRFAPARRGEAAVEDVLQQTIRFQLGGPAR